MKRLFLLLLVFGFMLTPNVANNICDGVKFIDAKCVNDDDAKYIKDVSLYTYDGYKYKKCCTGLLYEVKKGYNTMYYIVIKNTSITLAVYKNYDWNKPYNSWSVDNWGIYYYYNI